MNISGIETHFFRLSKFNLDDIKICLKNYILIERPHYYFLILCFIDYFISDATIFSTS